MTLNLTEEQITLFTEVVEHKPGLSSEEIARRHAEFEDLAQKGFIPQEEPLYLKMKMVGAHILAMKADFPAASEALNSILEVANRLKNHDWQMRTRNNLALVKQAMGEIFEAIEHWEELLREELTVADRVLYTNNLGVAYAKALKPKKAVEAYFSALELLQRNHQTEGEADVYNNLANLHRNNHQFDKALEYFNKALELYQQTADFERLAMIYNNFCSCYIDMREPDKAAEYGKLALDYYDKYMPEHTRSAVLNNVAAVHAILGDYQAAEAFYHKSLSISERFHDKDMQANVYNNLALLALEQNDPDRAIIAATKAQTLAHDIPNPEIEKTSFSHIKDAWQRKHDFAQAYVAQSNEIELERRIHQDNTPLDIAQAEASFLQKRLESQLDMYREQNLALGESNRMISMKTSELETRNNLLVATNALMNRIISIITHDVRGPVATIRQTTELMLKGMFKDQLDELVKHLYESSTETERLIEELLELARKYKAGVDEDPEEFDLIEALEQGAKLAEVVARSKDIKIHLSSNVDSLRLRIPRNRLQLIVRNLVSNAIKYSHPGSSVCVEAELAGSHLSLCVRDQGVGMTPSQIDMILTGASFSQPGTNSEKGFGMGLVFVLEAVMHTHGRLSIQSAPGSGSCFKVCYDLAEIDS